MTAGRPLALVTVCLPALLAGCQTKAPDPPPAPPAAPAVSEVAATSPASQAIDWAAAPDCQAKLGLLVEAAGAGSWRPDERPPIAVVLPGVADRLDWLASPSVTVAADLPLEVHQRSDPAISDAPCLLLVEPARDQRVAQRPIGQETVRSLYESGTRSERNPEYDAAQLRVRQAERAANEKGPGVLRVGDPLLDLFGLLVGGVISGFSQGSREREVDDAMSELATTPRSLEQPVYRAYQFERQTLVAGKDATIPVALVDRANRRLWRAQLHQRERRQFEIVEGLDPRDRDYEKYSSASVTRQDFERWQNEPPKLELSVVVAALREASATPGPETMTAAIDQLEASAPAPAPATIAPVGAAPEPLSIPPKTGCRATGAPGREADLARPPTWTTGSPDPSAPTAWSRRRPPARRSPGPPAASSSRRARGRRRCRAATRGPRASSASTPAPGPAAPSTSAPIWF